MLALRRIFSPVRKLLEPFPKTAKTADIYFKDSLDHLGSISLDMKDLKTNMNDDLGFQGC